MNQANINPISITDLIITHFHPDHMSGLPLLLMDLWLVKKMTPLIIHGLPNVLNKCKKMMALFDWENWEECHPIDLKEISGQGVSTIIDSDDIILQTTPVCHLIPTVGIKTIFHEGSICYSEDTAPCHAIVQLAKDCEILIHEAAGEAKGHSSPAEAGKIAQAAGVDNLFLIHYPPDQTTRR